MSFRTENITYYNRLHKQLERKRTKPTQCSKCGGSDKQIEWANISGEYKGLEDFKALCKSCHQIYDVHNLGKLVRGHQVVGGRGELVSTGMNKSKPTDTNWYENDHLFNQLQDLVNPQFKSWYMREFYRLGKDKVLILASQAKADGREPHKLFSKLIKNAKSPRV